MSEINITNREIRQVTFGLGSLNGRKDKEGNLVGFSFTDPGYHGVVKNIRLITGPFEDTEKTLKNLRKDLSVPDEKTGEIPKENDEEFDRRWEAYLDEVQTIRVHKFASTELNPIKNSIPPATIAALHQILTDVDPQDSE